jgi:ArsR family transcriptional regulator
MHTLADSSTVVNSRVERMARQRTVVVDDSVLGCCSPLAVTAMTDEEAQDLARVFGALGDPVRLRMLSIIASETEVCSCTLEQPLAKSQPTISHHTRVLSEAGLIAGERRGRWTWWRAVPERLDAVARLLAT